MNAIWDAERPPWDAESVAPECAVIDGIELTKGSCVRIRPHPGGDVLDLALAGKVAFVEAIEQDIEGAIHVAVTVEDDPGRDLGDARQPGHRFFFALDEVEPLANKNDTNSDDR